MRKIDDDVRLIFVNAKVPYSIIKGFADLEYASLQEFVKMYKDEDKLKEEAPAELGFSDGSGGYTAATSKRAAIRLSIAWRISMALTASSARSRKRNPSPRSN